MIALIYVFAAGMGLTCALVAWSDIRHRGVYDLSWAPAIVAAAVFYATFPLKGLIPALILVALMGTLALAFQFSKASILRIKQADLIALVVFATWPTAFMFSAPLAAVSSIGLLKFGRWTSVPFAGLLALFFVPAMLLLLI